MPVTLNFGNHQNYTLNETRLAHLLSSDREKATHMGSWDKLQEHFRTEKKGHALEILYDIIHGRGPEKPGEMEVDVEDMNKIYAFKQLQYLACPAHQDLFKIKMDASQTQFLFMVGDTVISQSKIQDILNVSDNVVIPAMNKEEKHLFLKICEVLGSNITWHPELFQTSVSDLRKAVTATPEIKEAVYKMMRPAETNDYAPVAWRPCLNEGDREKLACLNAGHFDITTQFSKIGYREVQGEVTFDIIHPCITYLLHSYSPMTEFKNANATFLDRFNEGFNNYYKNKVDIDPLLERIYIKHEHSLRISRDGAYRNILL
ncbi:TPA: SPI-1 type III secretion system effector SopD [Salmonella enterica]|nr:SPI-1 type III secretion system effector SopD [Salmonella enterica]